MPHTYVAVISFVRHRNVTFINTAYFRRFVLRRSILQEAIEMAEKANYHLVNVLLQMGEDPFSDKPGQKGGVNFLSF